MALRYDRQNSPPLWPLTIANKNGPKMASKNEPQKGQKMSLKNGLQNGPSKYQHLGAYDPQEIVIIGERVDTIVREEQEWQCSQHSI